MVLKGVQPIANQITKEFREAAKKQVIEEMESTKDDDILTNAIKLHNAKPMDNLPDCIGDCRMWLHMLRKDFSIPS